MARGSNGKNRRGKGRSKEGGGRAEDMHFEDSLNKSHLDFVNPTTRGYALSWDRNQVLL